jgi:hypothetical protein
MVSTSKFHVDTSYDGPHIFASTSLSTCEGRIPQLQAAISYIRSVLLYLAYYFASSSSRLLTNIKEYSREPLILGSHRCFK